MAITYTPFEELFASDYQLTYISVDGYINVGPNAYSVFHSYTMQERQIIFQVCEKHLPWETTQEQEQWERTMYMYQYIIKSPPPFPYPEYEISATEFLIYDKVHWMDKMAPERYAELIKTEHFAEKFLARYQRGDVVEVRPGGFWTGPKAKGFNVEAFRVVFVFGLKLDKKYMEPSAHKRRRFSISTGALQKVTVVSNINDLTITDKDTIVAINNG
jgi:hypothetical protein